MLWGCVAASSLVVGALLAWCGGGVTARSVWLLGFGAGALISSVSFEINAEGFQLGGPLPLTLGIVTGALTFFLADRGVARLGRRLGGGAAGLPLALDVLLDGIPEQAVLGIGLAQGQGVSVALLVAIFASNLPEAIGSSTDMKVGRVRPRVIILLWVAVAAVCALATVGGYVVASVTAERFEGAVDGFAAGALLVMLVGSMIPAKAGEKTGLAAVLGFAVAAGLSAVS